MPLESLFLKLSLQYESHAFESETEDYHDEEDEGWEIEVLGVDLNQQPDLEA